MSETGEGRLAGFLPYQLSVASNAVSDLIAERYRKRFALKIPEWRVMAILGDAGSMTQRALTAATRAISHDGDLQVSFGPETPGLRGKRARLPVPHLF